MPMHNNVKHIIVFQGNKIKSFNFSFHLEINSCAIKLQVSMHTMGTNFSQKVTINKLQMQKYVTNLNFEP